MISEPILLSNSAWTPITTAGKSGIVCICSEIVDATTVRIYHSDTSVSAVPFSRGILMKKRNTNADFLLITADSTEDIFYARTDGETLSVYVQTDVI